ncbi:MAG TPA: agmatinase [Methanotrichaceae archaeon]|nr:agmatinase [Methanotrichaceae archaeon]
MFRKCGYADAFSEIDDADFVVIGLPFDSTTSFRSGSRDGPDAIRLASYNFESYDYYYDVDLADLKICDLGNMELGSDPSVAWETINEGLSLLPRSAVPILLGGEHSIAPPAIKHLARQGGIGVLVLDAHLDLREDYGSTRFSHACASRRILETENLQGYASIGIRSGSKEEFVHAKETGLSFYTSSEVRAKGIDSVLDEAMKCLKCERLYLSLDMDVFDPAYAPAVGNPEPFGLTPWDVRRAVDRIAPKAVALDINEITPAYDRGETALLGARLVREFIAAKTKGRAKARQH